MSYNVAQDKFHTTSVGCSDLNIIPGLNSQPCVHQAYTQIHLNSKNIKSIETKRLLCLEIVIEPDTGKNDILLADWII